MLNDFCIDTLFTKPVQGLARPTFQKRKRYISDSHASTIVQLDNLKPIAIGDIKGVQKLNKWLTAVGTVIQKTLDCAPKALKTLKWTWKAKRLDENMDELKDFRANKKFPRWTDVTVEGDMSYYTDGLFKVNTDEQGVKTSDFFSKDERQTPPALKWKTTALTTRTPFTTHIAEEFIVKKCSGEILKTGKISENAT